MAFEPVNENEFRERLLNWRLAYGFSRARLEQYTGVSVSTLTRIEKGDLGVRLEAYNRLAAIMAIEPQTAFWDREKTKLFFYARGHHATSLFYAVVFTWLFRRRYHKGRDFCEVRVDGQVVELWADSFPGVKWVECGNLLRLPSEYGYMLVSASRQGCFRATVMPGRR